ncbi:FAD-dependent oxidoreductase [Candidatus Curtissbacteria bacterium]|nr:FAD-dependent oxidoreductase [Candidatus Curtissbacteria bacterium]
MREIDFLVIGGSAAGTTAAEVVRGSSPSATITIITDEKHEQYSRVLLPHYTRRKIQREQVFLKKPQWYQERKINLVKGTRVLSLDAKGHSVRDDRGNEYRYGKLLLAIGGDVIKLPVPGADLENVLYLRTIEDGDATIKYAGGAKKAVVVGGGFISLDFATSFRANGVEEITILIREPYFWANKLDRGSSKIIVDILGKNGVSVVAGEETAQILPKDSKDLAGEVVTKSGRRFDCDVVGVGIGIKSDLSWLADSGIKVDRAIVVNEFLETGVADVYAAGDCAQFHDLIFNTSHALGNWANATSQGKVAGENMAGGAKVPFETASSYSDSFFEGTYSFIGVTDAQFADEVITRGSFELGKMTRIYIKTIGSVMRIVGASVINHPMEVGPLTSIIKGKVDVSSHKEQLANTSFDLRGLISS